MIQTTNQITIVNRYGFINSYQPLFYNNSPQPITSSCDFPAISATSPSSMANFSANFFCSFSFFLRARACKGSKLALGGEYPLVI